MSGNNHREHDAIGNGTAGTDGQPASEPHYLQAKVLLKPDKLSSLERFHDFGKVVQGWLEQRSAC